MKRKEDADARHKPGEEVVLSVLGEKRDKNDDFYRKHEDALPPTIEANRSEIDKLIGEGTQCRDSSENANEFHPGVIGNSLYLFSPGRGRKK